MAGKSNKPSGVKNAPAPVDLSPPTAKKRTGDTAKRNLSPLPEVKTDNVQAGKNRDRGSDALPRSRKPVKSPPPRLGQGAYARKSRRRFRYSLTPAVKRAISLVITLAIVGVFVGIILLRLTSYNALAVYLDGRHVGHIQMHAYTTSESFHGDVIAHIEARARTNIITPHQITVRPARFVAGRNIAERQRMIEEFGRHMNYQIVARAIYVEDQFEVLVRGDGCVAEVMRLLREPLENANTQSYRILTPWRVVELVVDSDDDRLLFPLDAEHRLDRPVSRYHPYVIQSGDNLGVIAIRFNTTPERIANANNMSIHDIIHPGNTLLVPTRSPLISIETVEIITTEEEIPIQVVVQENPYLPTTHNVILQEGSRGLQSVSTRRTLVDGRLVSEEQLDAVVIRPARDEIQEVGTRPITTVEARW